jgi:pimeloyl-ACP methyl ester carboxylesterase
MSFVRFVVFLSVLAPVVAQQRPYQPVRDHEFPPDTPYTRYFTQDQFGRRITFYIDGDQTKRLPLVVSISGSGAFSNFIRRGDRILDAHRTEREVFADRAHIMIVEKPGVEFLEQHPNQGTAVESSPEFRREHTLERWAEAVSAATRAATSLPLYQPGRLLMIGHSEGGIVVARVAAENAVVTHVALLAAGGPTQLFDLMEGARAGTLYTSLPKDPEAQMAQLLADLESIGKDPMNTDKIFLGHPYRRWSSFLGSSPMEELARTHANIFLAQGSKDQVVPVTSFDVLYASLLKDKREVLARRIEGADHSFGFADQPTRDGWAEVFQEVRNWFFN